MTAGYNRDIALLARLVPMGRLTRGVRKDGRRVIVLPADYIIWNERIARSAEAVDREAGGAPVELRLTGTLSRMTGEELEKRGWTVHENAGQALVK